MSTKPFGLSVPPLFFTAMLAVMQSVYCSAAEPGDPDGIVQFGAMHQAIGMKQHQGRVAISELSSRPHFYAVGALAGLQGEVTILDSTAYTTGVENGRLQRIEPADVQATMLVGQSVSKWSETALPESVAATSFDEAIAEAATEKGLDLSRPFMFTIEGEFHDVRVHVINGACPVHARIRKLELDECSRPYVLETKHVSGTVVGIYAADAVGKLTHPATSTHAHLVFVDESTQQRVTGHLEQVGIAEGAVLRLPLSDDGSQRDE